MTKRTILRKIANYMDGGKPRGTACRGAGRFVRSGEFHEKNYGMIVT